LPDIREIRGSGSKDLSLFLKRCGFFSFAGVTNSKQMIAPLQLGERQERPRARSQQATDTSKRHLFIIDNGVCFDEQRATQIGHVLLRKSSNFKRRWVIAMGGSVFADVGREAGGPA
jgi:hypothetical protein